MSADLRTSVITIVAAGIAGALAGAAAGWTVSATPVVNIPTPSSATSTESPSVTVVPIERRSAEPSLPPAFLERRSPSVAEVYRVPNLRSGSAVLSTEARLGRAVPVTSDGWFAVPASVIEDLRTENILLWHDGRSATATRAVSDERSGIVYIKTPWSGLFAPYFASHNNVTSGLPVWVERSGSSLESMAITSVGVVSDSAIGTPSRITSRRLEANGIMRAGDAGAPVWSSDGSLVGVIDTSSEESIHIIPASAWSAGVAQFLSDGEIHHADLGIRSVDLRYLRVVSDQVLGTRGAWLQPNRTTGLPAVDIGSPAATAELKTNDVIMAIDRDILDGSANLAEILAQYRPGSDVTLTVLRDGVTRNVDVTLGDIIVSKELP